MHGKTEKSDGSVGEVYTPKPTQSFPSERPLAEIFYIWNSQYFTLFAGNNASPVSSQREWSEGMEWGYQDASHQTLLTVEAKPVGC